MQAVEVEAPIAVLQALEDLVVVEQVA